MRDQRESQVFPICSVPYWDVGNSYTESTVVNIKTHRVYEEIFVGTFQDGRMIEVTMHDNIHLSLNQRSVYLTEGQSCGGGSEDSLS